MNILNDMFVFIYFLIAFLEEHKYTKLTLKCRSFHKNEKKLGV